MIDRNMSSSMSIRAGPMTKSTEEKAVASDAPQWKWNDTAELFREYFSARHGIRQSSPKVHLSDNSPTPVMNKQHWVITECRIENGRTYYISKHLEFAGWEFGILPRSHIYRGFINRVINSSSQNLKSI